MRTLLLLPLLLIYASPGQDPAAPPPDGSPLAVLGFKWSKARQAGGKIEPEDRSPARALISANKNFQRNARINDPAGARDPNADTIDGRSAAIEKNVQESRTPKTRQVDGYAYHARVQNAGGKVVEIVFWEYRFIDPSNPAAPAAHRQFLCGVNIKPGKEKELQAFSSFGPTDVVNAGGLADKSENAFREEVLINRVEYTDGTSWQRKGWNASEIRQTYARAIATPWQPQEMCRRL